MTPRRAQWGSHREHREHRDSARMMFQFNPMEQHQQVWTTQKPRCSLCSLWFTSHKTRTKSSMGLSL